MAQLLGASGERKCPERLRQQSGNEPHSSVLHRMRRPSWARLRRRTQTNLLALLHEFRLAEVREACLMPFDPSLPKRLTSGAMLSKIHVPPRMPMYTGESQLEIVHKSNTEQLAVVDEFREKSSTHRCSMCWSDSPIRWWLCSMAGPVYVVEHVA